MTAPKPASAREDSWFIASAPGRWTTQAACAEPGLPSDLRTVFTTDAATAWDKYAQSVCSSCPVLDDCAAYARRVRGLVGIWGGRRRSSGSTRGPFFEPDLD